MRGLALLILSILTAAPAIAQRIEIVTGFEGGDRMSYAYGTASMALPVGANVDLIPRLTVSYLSYSYESASGPVSVRSPGVLAGVGVRVHAPGIALTVGPAIEVRQTTREVSRAQVTHRHAGLHLMADLWSRPAPRWTLTAGGSYSFVNDYGRSRAALMHQLTGADAEAPVLSAGLETMVQGNPEAHAYGAGGLLAVGLPAERTTFQLRFGYMHYVAGQTSEGRPYYGVGAVRRF